MKNKIEQELDRKEFENELGKDLKLEYEKLNAQEKLFADYTKYEIAGIHFFGTLIIGYGIFFILRFLIGMFLPPLEMLGLSLSWINLLIHGALWLAAVYSVYKKRSVLDDILDWILTRF